MLWAGIDTHLRIHRIEIQNEKGKVMWNGQIRNDRNGFTTLPDKIGLIEESNNQTVVFFSILDKSPK